jgi:16S rRNA G966 N2-methylase RsmD
MGKNKCKLCNKSFNKTDYYAHLKNEHYSYYEEIIDNIDKNDNNLSIKELSEEYNIPQKIIKERIVISENKEENNIGKRKISLKKLEPEDFKMEATTVWSFKNRGNWATHNGKYRGNWSPYIPRNIILRYSKEKDIVLDQFSGSGTTLVECKLLNRNAFGIDINKEAIKISRENLDFEFETEANQEIVLGDSRNLDFIKDESIDLICTHPPYSNIIKYSDNITGDLSHFDIEEFLEEMKKVARESYRVLKQDKYCAILIGDTRRKKHILPLGFRVMEVFQSVGFVLKEIIIKEQHNCKATGFWYNKSIENNFFLIAHEYLFVFRKPLG